MVTRRIGPWWVLPIEELNESSQTPEGYEGNIDLKHSYLVKEKCLVGKDQL